MYIFIHLYMWSTKVQYSSAVCGLVFYILRSMPTCTCGLQTSQARSCNWTNRPTALFCNNWSTEVKEKVFFCCKKTMQRAATVVLGNVERKWLLACHHVRQLFACHTDGRRSGFKMSMALFEVPPPFRESAFLGVPSFVREISAASSAILMRQERVAGCLHRHLL
jgi:hypothetical protein